MIGYITGTVIRKDENALLIKTQTGVGYKVSVIAKTLSRAKTGETIELFTHLHVREDLLDLYGFADDSTLEIFRQLITVSGIGPKTALVVLSSIGPEKIREAVIKAQTDVFEAVSGIGKKTAGRIILELQTKLGQERELDFRTEPNKEEALAALMNLGYNKHEAGQALTSITGDLPTEEQLKLALKNLGR